MAEVSGWLPTLLGPHSLTQEGGSPVTARQTWNVIGATVTDDPVNERTDIDFTAGAAGTPGGSTTEVQYRTGAATFGGLSVLKWDAGASRVVASSSGFEIANPAATFGYYFISAAIAADRSITLPLLAGNDTMVCEAFAQTLTNKTISGASNTITNVAISSAVSGLGANVATFLGTPSSANLIAAVTDETGTGSLVFGTSPAISSPTISGTPIFSATSMSATGNARARLYSDISNVQTTDATVTSLFTWTILDEAATCATAEVNGCLSTGADGAAYVRRIRFKRDGGTVTAGTCEATFTDESVGTWDCTIDNSTSTGRVRVTGVAATTIDWGGVTSRLEVSHA